MNPLSVIADFFKFLREAPLGTFALDASGIFLVLLALLITWSGLRFGKGLATFIFLIGMLITVSGWPKAVEHRWYLIGVFGALFLLTVISVRIFEREWKKKEWLGFIRSIARLIAEENDPQKRQEILLRSLEEIRSFLHARFVA